MLIRNVVSTFALVACSLAPVTSHAASLFGRGAANAPVTANAGVKARMVKFTLVNKTAAPMTLVINDQPMVLAANSETAVRLAEGSDILEQDRTTVRLHITNDLAGNRVSFR